MKKSLTLTFFTLFFLITAGFAQTSKFMGTWELLKPPGVNGNPTLCYSILRTFDEKGNYTQFGITANGSFIQSRANFEPVSDEQVKEVYTFAAESSKIGKAFNFAYRFTTENNQQLLITEGGTKVEGGYVTVEWREVWRKVEEYKAN